MRTLLRSLAVLSALTLPLVSAHATTYTFTPTLTDTTTSGNITGSFGSGSGPFSFNDPPQSTYVDSLTILANGSANGDAVTLDLAFTAPGTGTGTITGDASISGFYVFNYGVDYGTIDWDSASDTVDLSNGSVVTISLPTDFRGNVEDTQLNTCGNDLACGFTDVTLKVTDNDPPLATTPEPSSLALLGTGVLGLAGILRRRIKV